MTKKGNYRACAIWLDARARDLQNEPTPVPIRCRLTEILIDLPFGVVENLI